MNMNNKDLHSTGIKVQERRSFGKDAKQRDLELKIYDSFDALSPMRLAWDEFIEAADGEIFLSFDWCRIWWKYYGRGRELRVFVFFDDSKIVGIIPLFFEKIRLGPLAIKVGKIVGSDFTLVQFSLPVDEAYIRPVVDKMMEQLGNMKWHIIALGPIAGMYRHFDRFTGACRNSVNGALRVSVEQMGVQTYYYLPQSWQEYLKGLNSRERQTIRSSYHKIERKDLPFERQYASVENVDSLFECFVRTHQEQWRQIGMPGHFGDWPDAYQFHREQAVAQIANGRLRLMKIFLGEDCYAYQYSYVFSNKCFELLSGRSSRKSPAGVDLGRVLFAEQVKDSIKQGIKTIDSMRGEYRYKLRLGGKLLPISALYIARNNFANRVRVGAFRYFAALMNLSYYRIWYSRLAPKTVFRSRSLWKSWIKSNIFSRPLCKGGG